MNKQSDNHLRRSACALGTAWLALLLALAGCAAADDIAPASFALKGAEQVVTEAGSGVRTANNAWAELDAARRISSRAGSLTVWVKPLWAQGEGSHPLVSLRWQGKPDNYFALSQGWWEPLGAARLYLIVANQAEMFCSAPTQLQAGSWNMVTAVWRSGTDGYCRIFLNGELVGESRGSFPESYTPVGPLYLGSERGAADQRGRSTKADFAGMRLSSSELTQTQVSDLYRQEAPRYGLSSVLPAWVQARHTLPYQPRRDADGMLLESRVMFDEDLHWARSTSDADAILKRLKAAGFNVYVPCIYHGGGSWYPTSLLPPEVTLAERLKQQPDPLAYLIQKAHSMGIEVHPWFTVMYRGIDLYPQFFDDGTPPGAYNAHNEAFRTFIVNLMLDVVKRYDVDGINLDYIRTMGICTSAACAEDYARVTGGNLTVDMLGRYVLGAPRSRIEQWQDAAVKDIVARFSTQARQIKPRLIISVDGHPPPSGTPRALEGRNEVDWVKSGLVDTIFKMDYARDIDVTGTDAVKRELAVPERLVTLFGNYNQLERQPKTPRDGALIAAYAEYAQRKWPGSGMAFYIYELMSDAQVQALRAGPFKEPARPYWQPFGK